MGYEVTYRYHDRLPNGKWDTEKVLEMTKKLGDQIDAIELKELAIEILSQLSRRDKLVVDVEIYEYTKRKLNYQETPEGIMIRNKKFSFSNIDSSLIQESCIEENTTDKVSSNNPIHNPTTIAKVNEQQNNKPVKMWVTFDPEIHLLHKINQKRLPLTVGKKYPVYEIKNNPSGFGQVYTLIDDKGVSQKLSEDYFVVTNKIKLIGDDEIDSIEDRNTPKLSYAGEFDDTVPVLRPHLGTV